MYTHFDIPHVRSQQENHCQKKVIPSLICVKSSAQLRERGCSSYCLPRKKPNEIWIEPSERMNVSQESSFSFHCDVTQGHLSLCLCFFVSMQILGLVFSMTMFCQSVKVETFYA